MTVSDSQKGRLSTLADFAVVKRDPLLPCHIIPSQENRDFQGRDEVLARIEDCLSPVDEKGDPRKDLRTFAVCGPGGIGKTEVANEFALTHMDTYEVILWVHAEEAISLADEFSQIAETLGLVLGGTADATDLIVTRELVKGWLANPVRNYSRADNSVDEVPWLLVFDNLDNPDLLAEYWPSIGSCGAVLVTSRDGLAKTPFYQIEQGVDFPPLDNDMSAELLLKLTWREALEEERQLSISVADKLGGLPLAIRQMAGVMVRQSLSFADFLRRYDEAETHDALFQMSLEPRHKRTSYKHTIASVWGLDSLEYSSGLLDVIAFMDAKGIPEVYLQQAAGVITLPGYPKTVSEYQEARSELLRSSLVSHDRTESKLTVHRLIQDCVKAKMNTRKKEEVMRHVVELLWLAWSAAAPPGMRHAIARWKDCEVMSPHILRLKDHSEQSQHIFSFEMKDNLAFGKLVNELGW